MKHARFVPLLLVGLFLMAQAGSARAQDLKIAIANPAKIFNEMRETKDLKVKIETERKSLEAAGKEKQLKISALKEARDQLKPDAPQWADRNKELLQAAIDYKVWGELQNAEVQRNQKTQMKLLFDKIQDAITEIAKQRGVDLVIAEQRPEVPDDLEQLTVDQLRMLINQRNVMYANYEKADLSEAAIALLDSKYNAPK